MITKTKAIVLKNTNYGESSVICKMYTREFGLRTYILQSIRKGKSNIRPSMIQPLSLVDLDVYEKPNSSINRIKELKNAPLLVNIQDSIVKKTLAIFMVEVLNLCITDEQCEEELFDFLRSSILKLETEELDPSFPSRFLLMLSFHLGVEPQGECNSDTPFLHIANGKYVSTENQETISRDSSLLIYNLMKNRSVEFNGANSRRAALQELIRYYQYHIIKNKKLKSVDILADLLR